MVILCGCKPIRQERKPTGEKHKPDQFHEVAGHLEAGRNGRSVGLTTETTSGRPVRPKMAGHLVSVVELVDTPDCGSGAAALRVQVSSLTPD